MTLNEIEADKRTVPDTYGATVEFGGGMPRAIAEQKAIERILNAVAFILAPVEGSA